MVEIIRLVLDTLHALWPLRMVNEWERGVVLWNGRYWWTKGPGWVLILPWFSDVAKVNVTPEIIPLPLQTVTLRDGTTLTYSVSITVVVKDASLAYLKVSHFRETVGELAAAMVSEGLADADPARFDPARGKRDRLLDEIRQEINGVCKGYGLEVEAIRLNNFVKGIRTVRLLLDRANLSQAQGQNH